MKRHSRKITVLAAAAALLSLPAAPATAGSGGLDPTFSGNGIARLGVGDLTWYTAVDLQGPKPVAVGAARVGGDFDALLTRYTRRGKLDPTFGGGDGKVRIDVAGYDAFFDMVVLGSGKILAAGVSTSNSGLDRFLVMRFNENGGVDGTFGGGDGKVFTDFNGIDSTAAALLPLPDGRFMVCGQKRISSDQSAFALARYMPKGSLDTSFGGDGMVATVFPGYASNSCHGLGLSSDGHVIAGGDIQITGAPIAAGLARYKPNGNLAGSFDGDGRAEIQLGTYTDLDDVLVLANDEILFSGQHRPLAKSGGYHGYVGKLKPDGTFVSKFAQSGVRRVALSGGDTTLASLALDPSGRIVATGEWSDNSSPYALHVVVARLIPGGGLDTSFSGDGKRRFRMTNTDDSVGAGVVVQADGRIVVAGEADPQAAIARLLA